MEILVAPKLKKYKKIGLALGGGGARGFALIGVVKAFEECYPQIIQLVQNENVL